MNESVRAVALFSAAFVSIVVFGFGLIAPLTPSKGVPSAWEILLFLGAPLLLSGGVLYFTRTKFERLFMTVVLSFIVVAAAKVLWLVFTSARG